MLLFSICMAWMTALLESIDMHWGAAEIYSGVSISHILHPQNGGGLIMCLFPNSELIYGLLGSFVTLVFDLVLYLPFTRGISSSVDVL